MRLWGVSPQEMCRAHLLGEHREMHALVGIIRAGKSLDGYLRNKLIDTSRIQERHDVLAVEMGRRGYRHNSPLEYQDVLGLDSIDVDANRRELARRCDDCAEMQVG